MDTLLADGAGDYLHESGTVVAPRACADFRHPAAACGKKRCVPGEEPFDGRGLGKVTSRLQRYLENTFDMAVRGFER